MGNFASFLLQDEDKVVGYDENTKNEKKTFDNLKQFLQNDIEVVIDFSNSALASVILKECINRGIKVITGTSNIPNIDEIAELAFSKKISFVYMENFSKGINNIVNFLRMIDSDQIEIIEEHYYKKKDISQTAISLAKLLGVKKENISVIRTLKKESNHYIKYYLDNEEITISHKCLNVNAYKENLLKEYKSIVSNDFYFKYGILNNMK